MTRVAPSPPAESDLLCEFCGYTLNGLSESSNCPECGMPIAASVGNKRQPPLWERRHWAFVITTLQIIVRPTRFFSGITTRGDNERAARFGHAHWLIASLLFGIAGTLHASLFDPYVKVFGLFVPFGFAVVSYLGLWFTTWIAVRLTAWEAAYRGIRLPLPVVMRGMYYHAAHYLPVGLLAAGTVVTYALSLRLALLPVTTLVPYLYVICAEIIIAAAYLFKTYWIGMRNMMYANR